MFGIVKYMVQIQMLFEIELEIFRIAPLLLISIYEQNKVLGKRVFLNFYFGCLILLFGFAL